MTTDDEGSRQDMPLPTSPGALLPGVDLDDSPGLLDLMERW